MCAILLDMKGGAMRMPMERKTPVPLGLLNNEENNSPVPEAIFADR